VCQAGAVEPEPETGTIELDALGLTHGDATTLEETPEIGVISLGGQEYRPEPAAPVVRLDVSRTSTGYALRLRFGVELSGACFRCLEPASTRIEVDVREVDQPVDGTSAEVPGHRPSDLADDEADEASASELVSPYVQAGRLDLDAWARDALILSLPNQILCREDCLGLCSVCGESLNGADPELHHHDRDLDPRWAKLRDLG